MDKQELVQGQARAGTRTRKSWYKDKQELERVTGQEDTKTMLFSYFLKVEILVRGQYIYIYSVRGQVLFVGK